MAQGVLEEAKKHARFEPRCGPRVAPRVHRGALVEATGPQGGSQGILHAVTRHGCGGRGHAQTAPARRWNKPHRVAGGFPGLAEHREGLLWQRHRAVLRPGAIAHVHEPAGTSNVGHLQGGAFLEPQTTGIDGAQAGAGARQPHTLEERVPFLQAEDDGERVLLGWPHEGQGSPFPCERMCVEEREAAECHGAGAA
jgi:hypothetical protein